MNTWHSQTISADQGLIIDDETGRNVAVSYDVKDAKLIAAAPAMFELLEMLRIARIDGTQQLRVTAYAIETLLNEIDGGSR